MSIFLRRIKVVTAFIFDSRSTTFCRICSTKAFPMAKNDDNRLNTFREVCDEIAAESGYKAKAEILGKFFKNGQKGDGFKGDLLLWVQTLIPQASQRVYNLQNKQMLKLFGRIFLVDVQEMQEELEQDGDVSVVLCKYFEKSNKLKPRKESVLYLKDVDEFLKKLEQLSKEDEQTELLRDLCKQITALDLRTIIRLIKQDLRINARARHILDAFGPDAYPSYQASRDLKAVVEQFGKSNAKGKSISPVLKANSALKDSNVKVMTPISPMLANACKSVDDAFKKCPTGLFSEIKYDGERVQIHKKGKEFRFFSRNLKPVMEHKIKRFKEFIPKAFPGGGDMILDSEIILVDKVTGDLLPFGTLGAHKKKEHDSAEVCLFVFDCILFDGKNLTNVEFRKRREILEDNINPIKSYVQLSESYFLKTKNELSLMTAKVLKANLEGVVLKNPTGTYQPGKRGWLKVKKDYLFGGKMADTADLVVLGGWFGSGKKGGILSIFLMGCYDPKDRLWKTVTKVHSGLDDATNDEIHEQLMKLMQRSDANKLPTWLLCKKALVPDYIAKEPLKMPVWEITGAEFTKSEAHTAAGISIRFPRITRLRSDKSAEHANDLPYLQKLFDASKKDINVDLLIAGCELDDEGDLKIDSKLNINGGTPKKNGKDVEPVAAGSSKKRKLENDTDDVHKESEARTPKIAKQEAVKNKKTPQKNEEKDKEPKQNVKSSPLKQQKLGFGTVKKPNAKSDDKLIFKDLKAYFSDSLDEARVELLQSFQELGGLSSANSRTCDIVFHLIATEKISIMETRKRYDTRSRHLSIKWLKDSIEANKCLPYDPYALVL